MEHKEHRVLILAGGTGGHIFPALEVAKKLKSKGCYVHWIGTKTGLEAKLVPEACFPISFINIIGIRGKKWQKLFFAPFMLLISFFQSLYYVLKIKPEVVLGMGGFVSGPCGVVASLLRKKLIIHEQNSIVGTTNKILSIFANKVLYAFPSAFKDKNSDYLKFAKASKFILTGNPIREEFDDVVNPNVRLNNRNGALNVLILGGSRGAMALNECIPKVLKYWDNSKVLKPNIWHQTGAKLFDKTKTIYQQLEVFKNVKLEPFVKNIKEAYLWSDIVICRSGALTISELAGAGIPSILIPFPHAIDDHQTTNALFLSERNAAILLPQDQLSEDKIINMLQELTINRSKLIDMAENAYKIGNNKALDKVVDCCLT